MIQVWAQKDRMISFAIVLLAYFLALSFFFLIVGRHHRHHHQQQHHGAQWLLHLSSKSSDPSVTQLANKMS